LPRLDIGPDTGVITPILIGPLWASAGFGIRPATVADPSAAAPATTCRRDGWMLVVIERLSVEVRRSRVMLSSPLPPRENFRVHIGG
jgi:hypothetical protein